MNCEKCAEQRDYGMNPYVVNAEQCTIQNRNYRRAVWTGCYLQMTVMSISACEETGPEFHKDMDQYIRVEQGNAIREGWQMQKMYGSAGEHVPRRCSVCTIGKLAQYH